MRKHIDLFTSKKKQEVISPILLEAKKYGFMALAVLFVLLSAQVAGYIWLTSQTTALTDRQAVLTSFLNNSKGIEEKISYFLFKKNVLLKYIKDDAQFSVYYALFKDLIAKEDEIVQIDSFSIDNKRKTEFVLLFDTYEAAQEFLKELESPQFVERFEELKMNSLSVGTRLDSSGETKSSYRLELQGIFKEHNE